MAVRKSLGAGDLDQAVSVSQSQIPQTYTTRVWPGKNWEEAEPQDLGFDRTKLAEAGRYQAEIAVDQPVLF